MIKQWDDILDNLSTYQKTADAARILLENSQPDLACMILRDKLRSDSKFADSAPFVAITRIAEIKAYLFPVPPQTIETRLSTNL